MTLVLESPAFADGDPLPRDYARDGGNMSPPLAWSDPPEGTRSFALIVEDPDAPGGTFRHWALYNIPADRSGLTADVQGTSPGAFVSAVNDFGNVGYDGPQPPTGHGIHHYHFVLAALDTARLDLPNGADVAEVARAARRHVLEQSELVATYER